MVKVWGKPQIESSARKMLHKGFHAAINFESELWNENMKVYFSMEIYFQKIGCFEWMTRFD